MKPTHPAVTTERTTQKDRFQTACFTLVMAMMFYLFAQIAGFNHAPMSGASDSPPINTYGSFGMPVASPISVAIPPVPHVPSPHRDGDARTNPHADIGRPDEGADAEPIFVPPKSEHTAERGDVPGTTRTTAHAIATPDLYVYTSAGSDLCGEALGDTGMIVEHAPTATDPDYEWLGRSFQCPDCPTRVRFEISDLTGIPKIYPRKERDQWVIQRTCPTCGPMKQFREVRD